MALTMTDLQLMTCFLQCRGNVPVMLLSAMKVWMCVKHVNLNSPLHWGLKLPCVLYRSVYSIRGVTANIVVRGVWTDVLPCTLAVNPVAINQSQTSFSDDDDRKLKRGVLPKRATQIMKSWLFQHIAVCCKAVLWLAEIQHFWEFTVEMAVLRNIYILQLTNIQIAFLTFSVLILLVRNLEEEVTG